MKKVTTLFIAAVMGGFSSLGIYKLTLDEEKPSAVKSTIQNEHDNSKFVSLPPVAAENAVDFTKAAELSVNAVVHVQTMHEGQTVYYSTDPFHDLFFGPQRGVLPPKVASGSGVIVSTDGFIVTNNHVIKEADKIQVTLNNKKKYDAEVIGTDPETDIALLKIDEQGLPYIPYGNSDNIKIGEWVLAVGNPFNLRSTVTAGIVSAKGRSINILSGDAHSGISPVESFIQTDAAVNPGNSGGALVSTTGELVGINTAIKSNTGSYTGYSFAVPVNIVKKVVDDLVEYGMVQRAFIGISIRNIDDQLADENDLEELSGVYVAGLSENGAAVDAGIQEGDVILKIGNITVNDVPELQEQISRFRPGDEIMVTIKRNGKVLEKPVVLKNKFGSTEIVENQKPETFTALGAEFSPITKEEKRKLQLENGIKISRLRGGKLRSAGIKEGFIITKVDHKAVNTIQDLASILKNKQGGVLIEGVYPNGMKAYYGFGV